MRSEPCFPSLPGVKRQPSPCDLNEKPGKRDSDLKRGKPGDSPARTRRKKSGESLVQAPERHLLAGTVRLGPFGHVSPDLGQGRALIGIADRFARYPPGADTLLERRVIERLMRAQERAQRLGLARGGIEAIGHLALLFD